MPFWKNSSLSTFKTRSLGGSHGETASRLITFLVLVCLPNFVAACRSNTTPVLEGKLELLSVGFAAKVSGGNKMFGLLCAAFRLKL